VCPRAQLNMVAKQKSCSCHELNHGHVACSLLYWLCCQGLYIDVCYSEESLVVVTITEVMEWNMAIFALHSHLPAVRCTPLLASRLTDTNLFTWLATQPMNLWELTIMHKWMASQEKAYFIVMVFSVGCKINMTARQK